jgi:hypothetical protein
MKRFCASVLLLWSGVALAQGKPALRVVVEDLGAEAAACGLSRAAIESLASQALAQHGIAASPEPKDPYLYLNVNAYRVMQGSKPVGCTTRIGVSVRASAEGAPAVPGFRSNTGAYLGLCDAGRLLSGSQRDVAGAVYKAFREIIKTCLGQLSY